MTVVAKYAKAVLALAFSAVPVVVVEVVNLTGVVHVTVPGWEAIVVAVTPLLALAGVLVVPERKAEPVAVTPVLVKADAEAEVVPDPLDGE